MSRAAVAAILALGLAGCPEDDPAAVPGDTGEATSTTGAGAPLTDTEVPPDMPVGDLPAAGGIAIDFVEANQGVAVRIGEAGGPIDDRTAPLLANRVTLLRVFWTVPDGWTPREIKAQIRFHFADGTTEVQTETKLVEGNAFAGSLDETFNFGLMEHQAQPQTGYAVELYEADPLFADPAVLTPPRLPAEGEQADVGIEDTHQALKVVVVPFYYRDGQNCESRPDTSDETMQLFRDFMYMMNPVDTLEVEIHAPIEWEESLSSFVQLNQLMSELRFEEEAPPETYYYGLIDVCSNALGGAGGQAYGIPGDPTVDNAWQRVSSGLSLDPEWSAETFVHEVGHSQGRRHVGCSGTELGPDPAYPVEGGDLGEWGFGVIDFQLRHPTFNKDYMTYCHPVWVSTYGWNKVFPTIATLTDWGMQGRREAPYTESLLVGTILEDGSERWHTVPGSVDLATLKPETEIEFRVGGQLLARHGTHVEALPDGTDHLLITALPLGFDAVDELIRVHGSERIGIDPAKLHLRHHRRAITR